MSEITKEKHMELRSQFMCEAEDFYDNKLCGFPVPDQDIKGRWYLCNGYGDFTIVKPETIKRVKP